MTAEQQVEIPSEPIEYVDEVAEFTDKVGYQKTTLNITKDGEYCLLGHDHPKSGTSLTLLQAFRWLFDHGDTFSNAHDAAQVKRLCERVAELAETAIQDRQNEIEGGRILDEMGKARDEAFEQWKKAHPNWETTHPFINRSNFEAWGEIAIPEGYDLLGEWRDDGVCYFTTPTEALFGDETGRKFLMFRRGRFSSTKCSRVLGWIRRGMTGHDIDGQFEYGDDTFDVPLREAQRLMQMAWKGGAR